MRFKLDENLPAELTTDLRDGGHVADTVAEEGLAGVSDNQIVAAAYSEQRILLTLDKGITGPLLQASVPHGGIVLFRPSSVGPRSAIRFVRRHLSTLLSLELVGRVTVVTEARIRIR